MEIGLRSELSTISSFWNGLRWLWRVFYSTTTCFLAYLLEESLKGFCTETVGDDLISSLSSLSGEWSD